MRRRRLIGGAGIGGVVVALAVALLLGSRATGSTPTGALATMSNTGEAITLSPGQRRELDIVGGVHAWRLAARARRTFYRVLRADGGVCFAVNGSTDPDHLGATTCPPAGAAFPTPSRPVLDFTIFESTSHVRGDLHVVAAQGVSADGVASVALLDAHGRATARTRAADNVYALDVPPGRDAVAVAAYDSDGREVFRVP